MPPGDEPVRSRPDELWGDPLAWEDRPPRREASPPRREASPPRQRDREAYEPIAQLPERILSFALKAVFVLFALVAIVALLESL